MRESTSLVEVHAKYMHGSRYTREQKTRVLTRRNLPIESIALHYINILLVD